MNITQANLDTVNNPKWNISYRGSEFFNVKDLTDFEGIHQFVNSIYFDKVIYEKVCRAFFTDGPQIEMYINKKGKILLIIFFFRNSKVYLLPIY